MKNLLVLILIIIAIAMIIIGLSSKILPPTLTGIGFIIIAAVLYKKD